jgi:hypothetical protein
VDDLELSSSVFHTQAVQAYLSSRMLLSTTTLFPVGLYNAQLACECILKALTAQADVQPVLKHDLLLLNANLKQATDDDELSIERYVQILTCLDPYQELGRYGALARAQNDPDRVSDGSVQVRGAVSTQPSYDIKEIDYVFNLLRNKSTEMNDIISKVVGGLPVNGWNFPVSVEEVVLAQNDYLIAEHSN